MVETKAAGSGALDGVLPWVASEAVPDRVDERWWREVTERLGSSVLILQATGLNCGGERTWRCASLDEVARAVEIVGASRVSAFIDGISANVMGCVGADGAVLVLPVSRQLCAENNGRPLYSGNVFAGIPIAVRSQISKTRGARGMHWRRAATSARSVSTASSIRRVDATTTRSMLE